MPGQLTGSLSRWAAGLQHGVLPGAHHSPLPRLVSARGAVLQRQAPLLLSLQVHHLVQENQSGPEPEPVPYWLQGSVCTHSMIRAGV